VAERDSLEPGREPPELDALRATWRELEPPAPDAALDAPDPRAEAAVEWMRAAWRELEPPPAEIPWRLRARPRRRTLARLAAAAAILVALAWSLRELARRDTEVPDEVAVATVETGADSEHRTPPPAPAHGAGRPGGGREDETAPPSADTGDEPVLVALASDRMELRSGPVRLILITEPSRALGDTLEGAQETP